MQGAAQANGHPGGRDGRTANARSGARRVQPGAHEQPGQRIALPGFGGDRLMHIRPASMQPAVHRCSGRRDALARVELARRSPVAALLHRPVLRDDTVQLALYPGRAPGRSRTSADSFVNVAVARSWPLLDQRFATWAPVFWVPL